VNNWTPRSSSKRSLEKRTWAC